MDVLADTNVVSELVKPHPNPGVERALAAVERVYLSTITMEEIMFGLSRNPNPRLRALYERMFAQRVAMIPVSPEIAKRAGELRGGFERQGLVRAPADMMIAATAAMHGLTLLTRDVSHFTECGIQVVNPFG